MTKTVAMLFKFEPEVAKMLRRMVKRPHTLSGFVQDAVVKALRAHRAPLEYIAEGQQVEPQPLDRTDGVPYTSTDQWSLKGWEEYWAMNAGMRDVIDEMREEVGREPITDSEWLEVVEEMGQKPGWKKGKQQQ